MKTLDLILTAPRLRIGALALALTLLLGGCGGGGSDEDESGADQQIGLPDCKARPELCK